jgi:hypothetical protein
MEIEKRIKSYLSPTKRFIKKITRRDINCEFIKQIVHILDFDAYLPYTRPKICIVFYLIKSCKYNILKILLNNGFSLDRKYKHQESTFTIDQYLRYFPYKNLGIKYLNIYQEIVDLIDKK